MIAMITNLSLGKITSKATTQRTSFPFTSMCMFNGSYLATSGLGLYQLGGDTMDGEDIEAYFEPITTDFGVSSQKRLRFVYIGFESSGDLQLIVTADEQAERVYTIPSSKTGQQKIRVTVGRDGRGRYWNFRIKNISGCDFSIDSIEVLPVVLSHGYNSY